MAIESWFTNTINTHAHMPTANRICHLAELGGQGVKSHSQKDGKQHNLEGGPHDTWQRSAGLTSGSQWLPSDGVVGGHMSNNVVIINLHDKQYASTIVINFGNVACDDVPSGND